jgi:hypothetical protein
LGYKIGEYQSGSNMATYGEKQLVANINSAMFLL